MPSTYSKNLRLELIATGEQPGTWGETTNINLQALDDSIDGFYSQQIGQGGSGNALTITTDNAPAMSAGRSRILEFSGDVGTGGTVTIAPNDIEKWYFVRNLANGPITFQQGSGSVYKLEGGSAAVIHCTGTGSESSVYGTLSSIQYDKLLVTGAATIKGAVTLESTLSVTGASTLTGAVSCGAGLNVAGALSVTGASTLTGAVTMQSTLGVTGAVTMGSTLGVTGAVDCASLNAVGAVAANSLSSVGSTSVGSTLGVLGKTTLAGGLDLSVGADQPYDMYFRNAAAYPNTAVARLGIGAAGLFLRATASGPAWQSLTIPAGTPMGIGPNEVPYGDATGALTSGYLKMRVSQGSPKYSLLELLSPGFARFHMDGPMDGVNTPSHAIRWMVDGHGRWNFGLRDSTWGKASLTWQYYPIDGNDVTIGVSLEMTRSGRIFMGGFTDDYGSTVSITPHVPGQIPLIIRRTTNQTAHLTAWQRENGELLAYVDKDGKFVSVGTAASWMYMGRTTTWAQVGNALTGALFFYNSNGASNVYGGWLGFSYTTSASPTGNAASVYCQLRTDVTGSVIPVDWYGLGNSQNPRLPTVAELEEMRQFRAAEMLESIQSKPELLARLREILAA